MTKQSHGAALLFFFIGIKASFWYILIRNLEQT